jgi:Mg-chelatase subunit ChlI
MANGTDLPVKRRRTRLVDLPVSATEDRVVGTLDIEQAIQKGIRRFDPGVLASANRGLLYVDEVNLLDDHVVDLLLDSAAMGTRGARRISFSHPALSSPVADESRRRRFSRLFDRFAFAADIFRHPRSNGAYAILERICNSKATPRVSANGNRTSSLSQRSIGRGSRRTQYHQATSPLRVSRRLASTGTARI